MVAAFQWCWLAFCCAAWLCYGVSHVHEGSRRRSTRLQGLTCLQVVRMCMSHLPDISERCEAVYFLRNTPAVLVATDMDTQVDYGVVTQGPSLKMLEQVSMRSICLPVAM